MARTRRKAPEGPPKTEKALQEYRSYLLSGGPAIHALLGADTQTSLRLPQLMYDAVAAAAGQHHIGIGEELRLRLEASFVVELSDPETRGLTAAVMEVARRIEPAFGPWHQNRYAFDVLRAAILALLDLCRPAEGAAGPPDTPLASIYLGVDGGTPETVGRMLAGGAAVTAGIPMPGGGGSRRPQRTERN
jgi:hypothetical protein